MTPGRLILLVSGWLALAATLLPAASFERIVPTVAFLVLAPGAALVGMQRRLGRWKRGRQTEPGERDRLESTVLAVVLSLSLATLVSEGFFIGHAFTLTRAMAALAGITSVAALFPLRS